MIFERAREFIKYHFINNIVNNLLIIIHIAVILSMSVFVYSKSVNADSYIKTEPWGFTSEPKPMIFKHGNITYGNKIFIVLNKDCGASMFAWFSSYNKKKVKELEGKSINLKFELLTDDRSITLMNKVRVEYIHNPSIEELSLPFLVAHISLGTLDRVTRLLDMRKDGITGFYLSALTDEYFDVPHEDWGFEGIETAVSKALKWCGEPKIKRKI